MSATETVIDNARIGKKGYPMHYAALDLEPPVKTVPVEDGIPQTEHPGLSSIDAFRLEIQSTIDRKAQEKQYDSGATMASYVNSTIPEWATEAQQFVAWRDNIWKYTYEQLDAVQNGAREQPTIEDFLTELPVLNWSENNA